MVQNINVDTSLCVCMCVFSDNLASDGFYGLVIVLLALLGFISIVWLQDQIRNGGGPQWLEQDRIEVNRIERREAEDELNNLQAHLDENEELEAARQNSPERLEAAREVAELQEVRERYMKELQTVQAKRFDHKLKHLRTYEMELSYDLGVGVRHYTLLLRDARMKHGRNLDSWRELQRVSKYREEMNDVTAIPPETYQPLDLLQDNPPPSDWGEELTDEEVYIMKVNTVIIYTLVTFVGFVTCLDLVTVCVCVCVCSCIDVIVRLWMRARGKRQRID